MASYSFTYTDTTVTITLTGLYIGEDTDNTEIVVRPEPEDGTLTVHSVFMATSDTITLTFGGLNPDTKYAINARNVPNNVPLHNALWIGTGYFTTDPEGGNFEWTYAGLDFNGYPVEGTTKVAGLGVYITAIEWNELIDNINDKCGTSLGHVVSGMPISAAIANQAASALGVTLVSFNSPMSAAFFNALMDAVNNL